jgi:hypothetical protein
MQSSLPLPRLREYNIEQARGEPYRPRYFKRIKKEQVVLNL